MVSIKDIRALSKSIAREFNPDRIILFGSYAYGTATEDSDVDLMIVMKHRGNAARKAAEIRFKVRSDFPVDLIVRSPSKLRERTRMNDFFVREILDRGRVLYEGNNTRVDRKGRG